MLFLSREGFRRFLPMRSRITRARRGLRAAARAGRVFHLWMHVEDLVLSNTASFEIMNDGDYLPVLAPDTSTVVRLAYSPARDEHIEGTLVVAESAQVQLVPIGQMARQPSNGCRVNRLGSPRLSQ